MVKFNYEGLDYDLPQKWEEMTILSYISFMEYKKSSEYDEDYDGTRFFDALLNKPIGFFDDMSIRQIREIYSNNEFDFDEKRLKKLTQYKKQIVIDGDTFSYPKTMEDMSNSEYVTFKNLSASLRSEEQILKLFPILLRKSIEIKDEFGNITYKREKLDTSLINERYEYLKDKVLTTDVIGCIAAFIPGRKI